MGNLTLDPGVSIGWKNYGFLLMGHLDPNQEKASFLFAGTDQYSETAPYEYNTAWSKVRVYARKVNSGHDIYSSTYSLTPSQPTSLFDICGSFIDRREIIPTSQMSARL